MKRCHKCKTLNPLAAAECDGCGVVFADIRGRAQSSANLNCTWNDHGHICGKHGSMADSTNGQGPWYCSEHYWKLKGWEVKPVDPEKPHTSFRERHYTSTGAAYQNPRLGDLPPFKCVGLEATMLHDKMRRGEIGKRQREPGDDDEIVVSA